MGNPKRQLPEVHLTHQEIHTAPGVHLGLDAADKLTSEVVHLLAELSLRSSGDAGTWWVTFSRRS